MEHVSPGTGARTVTGPAWQASRSCSTCAASAGRFQGDFSKQRMIKSTRGPASVSPCTVGGAGVSMTLAITQSAIDVARKSGPPVSIS